MNLSTPVIDFINGVGQKQAAEFFGVSQPLVSSWVSGNKPVPLKAVQKIMDTKPELFSLDPSAVTAAAPVSLEPRPEEVQKMPWEGKDLVILSTTNRYFKAATHHSLMELYDKNTMYRKEITSNFLVRARNQLAQFFLDSGAQWAWWVDDDMVFPCGDADWFKKTTHNANMPDIFAGLNTIKRLLWHKQKLIGACYFGRSPDGKGMFHEAMANKQVNQEIHTGPKNAILPTKFVATGGLLTHISVLRDIIEKVPGLELPPEYQRAFKYKYGFFDSIRGRGEDDSFCERAILAGHQPYVDLAVMPAHVGDYYYNYQNTKAS